jgi:SAM-dependent methyltransferase
MTQSTLQGLFVITLTALAAVALARQCRKPTWWPGRLVARIMNSSHAEVTTWGLKHIPFERHFTILDVGCGGGRTIQQLLALAPEGKVYGIDYADASVTVATKINASSIVAGFVDVRRGSVSNLSFPPHTFDVVTAVETHYYWPDLEADLKEVRRVLKPGGRLAIIAESYRSKRFDVAERFAMYLLAGTLLTPNEHREALIAAGYAEVEVFEESRRGWICALGRNHGQAEREEAISGNLYDRQMKRKQTQPSHSGRHSG